jgi:hypothetical protein
MAIQVLEKLFGSSAKVKIMKFFLFNPQVNFDKADIDKNTNVTQKTIQKEINTLESIGFIKNSSFFKTIKLKKGSKKKRVKGYTLNEDFIFLQHLKGLLINTTPLQHNDMTKKIGKACKVKLIVASGIFIQSPDENSRIDLLIVGDSPKLATMKKTISQIESEIGQEIRYSFFSTEDFKYRLNLYDHLIRDIFDYPHQILVDKIGL